MAELKTLSEHACFGGRQGFYAHESRECGTEMRFSVYVPPLAEDAAGAEGTGAPVLYYLAGLSCTEETFMIKGGAQRLAAKLGILLVAPDTSPRAPRLPGDDAHWDFGLGAGFYVDATCEPWARHYRMYSYVTRELPEIIAAHFPARMDRQGIFGHSMGGHGALVCALRNPEQYRSVSAFAPVAAPSQCPWGVKAFGNYLGPDQAQWAGYDATELARRQRFPGRILIDQGTADKFLATQLHPEAFSAACQASGQQLTLRMQPGYDHGYYFISTFMADHLRHHAEHLHG